MAEISPEFIEKYQLLHQKNPKSKVFAPLAEAYRKMGLPHRAYSLCLEGLKHHPYFAGGRIALARALSELGETKRAIQQLEKATELAPENILAHSLLAEFLLKSRRPKEALSAYKMLLFLSPNHVKAQAAVKKLESLGADEFQDEELFPDEIAPLPPAGQLKDEPIDTSGIGTQLERYLSLIDALIVRNDLDKALKIIDQAHFDYAQNPELRKRLEIVQHRSEPEEPAPGPPPEDMRAFETREEKIKLLQDMLYKVANRREDGHEKQGDTYALDE